MFNSGVFWMVLAATTAVYWLLPARLRAGFLALASFAYLFSVDRFSVSALTGLALLFYFAAPGVRPESARRRTTVAMLIAAVLGFLAYFKYVPPLLGGLGWGDASPHPIIPLGISFYTFKLIHYIVEVARGTVTDRSLPRFMCWLYLFPIFTAGPIERFDHFLSEQESTWRLASFVEGATRIVHGLIKKFVIAEIVLRQAFGSYDDVTVLASLSTMSTLRLWIHLGVSYLYLYMDFSAYTDLAIGSSRLFGFRIAENFRWPILATSLGDFWRRWHLTLSGWCQSYVYMPLLGLYRNPYVALYGSFIVFGLWHAGTLVRLSWGIYHATGVAVFMTWSRWRRARGAYGQTRSWWQTIVGYGLTQGFVTAGMGLLIVEGHGDAVDALRVMAKLVFIDLGWQ